MTNIQYCDICDHVHDLDAPCDVLLVTDKNGIKYLCNCNFYQGFRNETG